MGEIDDAIGAIDELKEKLNTVGSLGDTSAQINNLKEKLNAIGNLGDVVEKLNGLRDSLKLQDKLMSTFTKWDQLMKDIKTERVRAIVTTVLTLLDVGQGVYELKSTADDIEATRAEMDSNNADRQSIFQAMDTVNAGLVVTDQLRDIATQISDLKGKLDALQGLGDVASRLSELKEKLDTAEEKMKSTSS